MNFREDIQGLRALAFLTVFIFHFNKDWLPGGFLGVDIFFVISGYLITKISLHEINAGTFGFKKFFEKRIKRIVPAYYFMLFIIAWAAGALFLWTDIDALKSTLISALLFYSNKSFATGQSYFGAKFNENPLLHTWSLAIEMQFYVFLPLLLYYGKKQLKLLLPVILIALSCYATYKIYVQDLQTLTYFSLTSRIPEFLVGCCYALFFKNGWNGSRFQNDAIAFLSLAVLTACLFLIDETSAFPGVLSLVPCAAVANMLVVGDNQFSKFFSTKLPVYIGKLSYSLYLWHWPVMAFLRYRKDVYNLSASDFIWVVSITAIGALFSFYFIEDRLRKVRGRAVMYWMGASAIVCAAVFYALPALFQHKKIPEFYSEACFGLKSHNTTNAEKLGDRHQNDSILLIGDSHALMIKPFLDRIGKKNNFSFLTLTCDSYPALSGIKSEEIPKDKKRFYNSSTNLVKNTQDLLYRNKIILINSTDFYRPETPSLGDALETLAKHLKPHQSLIIFKSFPKVNADPLKKNLGILKNSDFVFNTANDEKNLNLIKKIVSRYPRVYYYDLSKSKIFRNAPYINDTVAYYNKDHINTFGSLRMADDLEEDFMTFFKSIKNRQ